MFFLLDICLPMFCFTPFSSIITVGGIAWKKPSTNPSLLRNARENGHLDHMKSRKMSFGSHDIL